MVVLYYFFSFRCQKVWTSAVRAAAVTLLMAIWWITEAIPISATALVPMVLFSILGILDAKNTAENYGHNYVLMLLGGFMIAKAIEIHNLHWRMRRKSSI